MLAPIYHTYGFIWIRPGNHESNRYILGTITIHEENPVVNFSTSHDQKGGQRSLKTGHRGHDTADSAANMLTSENIQGFTVLRM